MNSHDLLATVDSLLAAKEDRKLKSLLMRLSAAENAQVINRLQNGKRKTFAMLPPELQAETVLRLTENSKTFVLPRISDHTFARFLHFNEEDDAADILQFLSDDRRQGILSYLKPDKRAKIEKLLTFHPETAGGLMDLNFITVESDAQLKEVGEKVKEHALAHRQTPMVVVLGAQGHVKGYIPYRALMLAPPGKTVEGLIHPLRTLPHGMDQEKIVRLAMREKGDLFGVVDDQEHFLGLVHLRDLLKVAQMEATEDVLKFAGVSPEEDLLASPQTAIRMRYKWLIVNLATAFVASAIVGLFQDTISRFAVLAVYMPIVAGMGGNAGTQTLAVAVRGLALGDVTKRQRWTLIWKEILAGAANGIINGVIVAAYIAVTEGSAPLGLILAASMVINLVAAGIAGAVIPLTLRALKIDPAVASTVFVTTVTDVVGFASFLGLATIFLQ